MAEVEPLEGIADADARLGRPMPLPGVPLPLTRWVDVIAVAPHAVEVSWNLDDSRPDAPGRVALYAGQEPPPPRELADASEPEDVADGIVHREAPLTEAQPSLRPVHELRWRRDGLHLRLTAQGPWAVDVLLEIARSVA
jgi:hypothetical protein